MNAPIRAQQAQQQIEIRHAEPQVGYGAIQGAGAQDPDFQRLLAKPSYDPRHLLYGDSFDRMLRIAEVMASGKITVPPHLRGNTADCLAIVMQAMRWGADPFAVAQKSYVVDGHLGFESQLVGAILNASGAIEDAALKCEYFGPWEKVIGNYREVESRKVPGTKYRKLNTSLDDEKGVGIRVWATLTGESEPRELEFLLTQAGVRNSTLWADDPKQQIFYTAQARWTRRFAPGAILGLFTIDEMGITDRDPDDDLAPPPVRGPQRKSSAAAGPAAPSTVAPPSKPPAAAEPPPQQGPRDPDPETGEVAPPKASPPTPPQSTEGGGVTTGQIAYLRKKMAAAGITESSVCERYGVAKLEDLTLDAFDEYRAELVAL